MNGGTPFSLRIGIGAIVRNEAPYLLEWIAFHRVLGIERFFIADNGSTDGSGAILAALAAAGVVHHLPFPGRPGTPPQLPAYEAILRRHGGEADWIAFIDADEFLLPAAGLVALDAVLAPLAASPGIGAIVVNWAVYGSAGHLAMGAAPVTGRFGRRAEAAHTAHHHFKSIVRTCAPAAVGVNPHVFHLVAPYRTVHCDGRPVRAHPRGIPGLSAEVVWAPLRLNHYVVKSREEFMTRKLPRGRATTVGRRDPGFFEAHDRNEVADPVPPALAYAARREEDRLAALLPAGLVLGGAA